MDWTDRLVRSHGAYMSWTGLLETVRAGARRLAVGELSRRDADYLRLAAHEIDARLDEQAARDAAGKDGG